MAGAAFFVVALAFRFRGRRGTLAALRKVKYRFGHVLEGILFTLA